MKIAGQTPYEWVRRAATPVFPAFDALVTRDLRLAIDVAGRERPRVLDVGGRTSPYTVGLDADITIMDLPRRSEVQETLELGITDDILAGLKQRRSNVTGVVLEDMTRCTAADDSYDGVVAVEVIEHVPDDDEFLAQIRRVLRPGGWAYLTTPNGDYVKNEPPHHNPDHLRHYRRADFAELLGRHFDEVEVEYAISTGKWRYRGQNLQLRQPHRAAVSMISNIVSQRESRDVAERSLRTANLVARIR